MFGAQSEPGVHVEVLDVTHMAGYSNLRASQPGQYGTPFLEGGALSNPGSATGPNQQGMGAVPRTSPPLASTAAPWQETPVQTPTANEEPPAPGSSPQVIKDWLRKVNACYSFAYGLQCPYQPSSNFKHEASRIPSGHYQGVVNSNNNTLAVLDVVADMKDE